jgi:hypothetical protein
VNRVNVVEGCLGNVVRIEGFHVEIAARVVVLENVWVHAQNQVVLELQGVIVEDRVLGLGRQANWLELDIGLTSSELETDFTRLDVVKHLNFVHVSNLHAEVVVLNVLLHDAIDGLEVVLVGWSSDLNVEISRLRNVYIHVAVRFELLLSVFLVVSSVHADDVLVVWPKHSLWVNILTTAFIPDIDDQ